MAAATAIIAAAALGYGVYAGERGAKEQREARYRIREAQAEALRTQMVERSRSVRAEMDAANRPSPASTIALGEMLATTDRAGVVDDRLRLGRQTKLGGT